MASQNLPADIVAVESGNLGYLFYVNAKNELSYFRELPDKKNNSEFEVLPILNNEGKPVEVCPDVKQIAATAWTNGSSREIRVYFCAPANPNENLPARLAEYCLTNRGTDVHSPDAAWYPGSIQDGTQYEIRHNSSMSATLKRDAKGVPTGIRVYASQVGVQNKHKTPAIAVFKYDFDTPDVWNNPDVINTNIKYF